MSKLAHLKKKAAELEQKRLFEKALSVYEEILQEQGSGEEADVALLNRIGDLYLRQGAVEPALRLYEQAVELYADRGFLNNAIALCNKILRQDPRRAEVHLRLGRISSRNGFRTDARRHFLEYTTQLGRMGSLDQAIAALDALANEHPEYDDVRIVLADVLVSNGRKEAAVEQLQRARELYEQEGRHAEAQSVLGRILELDPDFDTGGEAILVDGVELDGALPGGGAPTTPRSLTAHRAPAPSDLVIFDPATDPHLPAITRAVQAPEQTRTGGEWIETAAASLDAGLEMVPLTVEAPDGLLAGGGLDHEDADGPVEFVALDLETTAADAVEVDPGAPSLDGLIGREELSAAELPVAQTDGLEVFVDHGAGASTDGLEVVYLSEPPVQLPDVDAEDIAVVDVEAWSGGQLVEEVTDDLAATSESDANELVWLEPPESDSYTSDSEIDIALPEPATDGFVDGPAVTEEFRFILPDDEAAADSEIELFRNDPEIDIASEDVDAIGTGTGGESWVGTDTSFTMAERPVEADGFPILADRSSGSDSFPAVEIDLSGPDSLPTLTDQPLAPDEPTVAATDPVAADIAPANELLPASEAEAPVAQGGQGAPAGPQHVDQSGQSDSFVNLGDWLREDDEPRSTRMVAEERAPSGDEQADFAETLRKFKQGVADNVDEDDHASHYDLGIAFREMGLVDEAIAALQKALRGTHERVRTFEALGQCFLDREQYAVATSVLQRALNEEVASDERLVGILYLLGRAAEAQNQRNEALGYYQRVFAVDIEFGDVSERIGLVERVAT